MNVSIKLSSFSLVAKFGSAVPWITIQGSWIFSELQFWQDNAYWSSIAASVITHSQGTDAVQWGWFFRLVRSAWVSCLVLHPQCLELSHGLWVVMEQSRNCVSQPRTLNISKGGAFTLPLATKSTNYWNLLSKVSYQSFFKNPRVFGTDNILNYTAIPLHATITLMIITAKTIFQWMIVHFSVDKML